jgi:hypothetical protein
MITAKRPIRTEPETLTIRVPQGNVSPKVRAAKPGHKKRSAPPRPAPRKIQPDKYNDTPSTSLFTHGTRPSPGPGY